MNEMSTTVIELLSGNATVEQVASQFELAESDLLAGITGSLGSTSARERQLEEENRLLREALIREATLRAELLGRVRLGREPSPRPRRRRRSTRGLRHRRLSRR